jgi:hypothetical protein
LLSRRGIKISTAKKGTVERAVRNHPYLSLLTLNLAGNLGVLDEN